MKCQATLAVPTIGADAVIAHCEVDAGHRGACRFMAPLTIEKTAVIDVQFDTIAAGKALHPVLAQISLADLLAEVGRRLK